MSHKSGPRISIELLARRFPQAFFVNGERRRPLKIGIVRDLVDAAIGIPGTQIGSVYDLAGVFACLP
jgi:sRNA-binding protein